ncbi:TPA: hypothetical protein ACP32N_003246 [Pseudomonas aeruginosa]
MNKTMNKKHVLIASIAAAVVVFGGATAMLSSSGKKAALSYYDNFKERYFLQDVLSEGDVSYSVFSGNLTVKNPEIRVPAVQTNGAEQFLNGLRGLVDSTLGHQSEDGLVGWAKYQMTSTAGRNAGGVYLKADALKISHSGDSKNGEIHVQLLGMDMSNPFISHKAADVVLVGDLGADNEWASADKASSEVKMPYSWGNNMAVRSPVTGAFIIGATGEFGTKVDLDFTIKRSDDGEGSMKFVVTHRLDGSEVGQIVRKAEFASIPELDDVQDLLKSSLSSYVIGAYSSLTGLSVLADSVSGFARKAKVEDYSVTYKGFSPLKDAFGTFKANAGKAKFEAFCQEVGLSTWQSDFGAKAKGHSDSECAIAQKLVEDGKFEEQYKFIEGKTLFASIFVSRGYELETN